MARQSPHIQPIEKLDPVWHRIREEAEAIAKAEPSLGGFIFGTILNHEHLEQALTHRLAQRLTNADISAELIIQAFEDALESDPDIGVAARADILAVYDAITDQCFYIPAAELGDGMSILHLRLAPARNNQRLGTRPAELYHDPPDPLMP